MRTSRIVAFLLCLGFAGVLVAGCGQNKKSKGASEHPLNKTEFIGVANAICAPVNKTISAAQKALLGNGKRLTEPTPQAVTKFVTQTLVPQIDAEIEKLRAVPAPIGDMNIVKTIYNDMQSATDKLKANPQLLAAPGPSPYAQAQQLAKGYGLTVCARTGSAR